MTTLTLEVHGELADWLQQNAARRNLSVERAALRLLDEARMVDLCLTEIEVPEGDDVWSVCLPTRAQIYAGYEPKWTRLSSTASMISKD